MKVGPTVVFRVLFAVAQKPRSSAERWVYGWQTIPIGIQKLCQGPELVFLQRKSKSLAAALTLSFSLLLQKLFKRTTKIYVFVLHGSHTDPRMDTDIRLHTQHGRARPLTQATIATTYIYKGNRHHIHIHRRTQEIRTKSTH